jgi:anti-anti-sigma factor
MTLTVVPPSGGAARGVRPALMTVVVRTGRTRTIVVLRGEADYSTAPVLSDALSRASALGVRDVVIDLGELRFIDCASCGVFAVGRQSLGRQGRKMTFRSPSRLVARVLGFFELSDLIEAGHEGRT